VLAICRHCACLSKGGSHCMQATAGRPGMPCCWRYVACRCHDGCPRITTIYCYGGPHGQAQACIRQQQAAAAHRRVARMLWV
jgi:hypothetical protein